MLDDVGPELVGSRGALYLPGTSPTVGSLTMAKGGTFEYQFMLPGSRWAHVELDFGSLSGSTSTAGIALSYGSGAGTGSGASAVGNTQPGTSPAGAGSVAVSAFNYLRGNWSTLRTTSVSGSLVANIPVPAPYLGPTGAVQVRLSAIGGAVDVFGDVPTLSATPAGTAS